ncbi:MAG: PAS domain-containing protein [Candidatus Thiodiazotropha sp.]|jgi:PAS domain S-box-containing protein
MTQHSSHDQEVMVNQSEFMVTKSDLKGNLIYANRAFMQITGYPEYEILGKPLNLFRHPDMPKGMFRLLWDHLENDQECYLYLKNRTRDGDFYWTFTNTILIHDPQGKPATYFSAQRRPSREGVSTIIPIYQEMLTIEHGSSGTRAAELSLQWLTDKLRQQGKTYDEYIHTLGH